MVRSIEAVTLKGDERGARATTNARLRRIYSAYQRPLFSVLSLTTFFSVWEWFGTSGMIKPLFISSPSAIVRAGVRMFADGSIWNDLYVSGTEFVVGFALAIAIGIPLGMALGWYRRFNYALDPFVSALNATSRVALMPDTDQYRPSSIRMSLTLS